LTGCFPGTLNIPGIRWLDKAEYRRRRWGLSRFRSYNGIEAPLFNSDLPKEHPTLFEIFQRPYNIFSMITRGLPKGHNLTARSKLPAYLYAHLTDDWNAVDRLAFKLLMRCLDLSPDFVFAVFPGVDSYSHLNHPRHDKTISAYRFVDTVVGEVVAKLKRLGRWHETLLVITSDHGLTATDQHLDLALFLQGRGIRTMYYPIVWKYRPQASVMISGNALGQIYWLDGENVGRQEYVLGELLSRPEVDLVITRGSDGVLQIDSANGRAFIDSHSGLRYMLATGDPLRNGAMENPMNHREALEATYDLQYPDALVQVDQLFSSSRCGDMVVISKIGYDLRSAFEWPEHHASHGSLCREHMIVPLIYNQSEWDRRPARTTDIFNTILKWSGRAALDGTDGDPLI
jgi:hypothetical protein